MNDTQVSPEVASPKPLGRRPDPGLEARVFAATVDVYGEVGWSALTIDAVAKRSRAGKAAIYARWGTKEALLQAALVVPSTGAVEVPGDTIREQFVAIARGLVEGAQGPWGLAMARINVEVRIYPEVLGPVRDLQRRQLISGGRDVVSRAIERGDLMAGTSPALLLDALAGTIEHHIAQLPSDRIDEFNRNSEEYIQRVVDFVLVSVAPADGRGNPRRSSR